MKKFIQKLFAAAAAVTTIAFGALFVAPQKAEAAIDPGVQGASHDVVRLPQEAFRPIYPEVAKPKQTQKHATKRAAPKAVQKNEVKETPPIVANETSSRTVVFQAGEKLRDMLLRAGVAKKDAHGALSILNDLLKGARKIKAGTGFDLVLDGQGGLRELSFYGDQDKKISLSRDGKGKLKGKIEQAELKRERTAVAGQVTTTLYQDGVKQGASPSIMIALADLFAEKVDSHKIKSFKILSGRGHFPNGEKAYEHIVYASVSDGHDTIEAFRVKLPDNAGHDYVDRQGRSLKGLAMPFAGRLESGFGLRQHPVTDEWKMHEAIDLSAPEGTPIEAVAGGVVEAVFTHPDFGNAVIVDHGKGRKSLYAHMLASSPHKPKDVVKVGDVLGKVGRSGLATGPHLHLQFEIDGKPVDPLPLMAKTHRLSGPQLAQLQADQSQVLAEYEERLARAVRYAQAVAVEKARAEAAEADRRQRLASDEALRNVKGYFDGQRVNGTPFVLPAGLHISRLNAMLSAKQGASKNIVVGKIDVASATRGETPDMIQEMHQQLPVPIRDISIDTPSKTKPGVGAETALLSPERKSKEKRPGRPRKMFAYLLTSGAVYR